MNEGIQKLDFYKGVDISSLLELEDNGIKLYTEAGLECEALSLCRQNGVNSIRLRIWNEPRLVEESGGYCDLEHTVIFGRRIKEAGLHFLLDFHYSDFWADPGNQRKPAAWTDLSGASLEQAVYDYTKAVLERLGAEGCLPDMVQIGNEIRSGMLFPDGEVPDYEHLAGLVNAGIRAARDVDGDIQVMIHLDQGGRYYYLREWFDAMLAAGLAPFDVIGISYYPFWHGTFTDLRNCMESMAKRYDRPIVIVEAAHPWRRTEKGFVTKEQEKIAGFPAGVPEQCTVMRLLMNIAASVADEKGIGVYYWEPLVLPMKGQGRWGDNMGMLDVRGRELPAFKEFLFDRTQMCPDNIARIYDPEPRAVQQGMPPMLPETVQALHYDGSRHYYRVEWDPFVARHCGNYRVKGRVPALREKTQIEVEVIRELPVHVNLMKNTDFAFGERDWMIVKRERETNVVIDRRKQYLRVESRQNFFFAVSQEVRILQEGTYVLSVMYRGANTTGVDVRLYGEQIVGADCVRVQETIHPTDEQWVKYEIGGIRLAEGTFIAGLEIKSPPVMGMIREFTLYQIDEGTSAEG